jgi:hypothetical protein
MDETFRKVEEHLRKILPARNRVMPITPETELYSELGMYGDVLAFDLVLWAQREFGVEANFRMADYAPGGMPNVFRFVAKLSCKRPKEQ